MSTTKSNPAALAIDADSGKLYWSSVGGGMIRRADLDGSNQETVVSGLSFCIGIALDLDAGKLYWSDETDDLLGRSDLDGSNAETLLTSGLDMPRGIDVADGMVYWADRGSQSIQRLDVAAATTTTLVSGLSFVQDVAVDTENSTLYWIDDDVSGTNGMLYQAALDGSGQSALISGLSNPKHLALLWEHVE